MSLVVRQDEQICELRLASPPGNILDRSICQELSTAVREHAADPHLKARGAFVTVDHPELGELELVGAPWKMSGAQAELRPTPLLGQDNEYVLQELLGLSPDEVEELRRNEVIL